MACEFCGLSEEEKKWLLTETKHWVIYLADVQDYLGRSIIVSKRHCESLSELTTDEWQDLQVVIKSFEKMLKNEMSATMFNWSCLMNDAYKQKEPCPHVHFHVRPRYEAPISVGEMTYVDEDFAHHYNNQAKSKVMSEVVGQVFARLKGNISNYFEVI